MSHVLCVHGPWLNGHVSDSRLYAMYFRAVCLCLRTIRAMALSGGGDDKRAAAAYPKLRLPSSYLLSSVLEKEEGYVIVLVMAVLTSIPKGNRTANIIADTVLWIIH